MRIWARALLGATLLLPAGAGPLVSTAMGGTVAVSFAGTVNPPPTGVTLPPNVVQGDTISGSFQYNSSQPGSNGVFSFTNSTPAASMLFVVPTPGYTPADFSDTYIPSATKTYTITVTDNQSGPGATLDFHVLTAGSTINKSNAYIDIILTSSTYTGKLALPTPEGSTPTTLDISSFLTTAGKLVWDPGDTGLTATLTQFNGYNVLSVPEPSSLVLAGVALASCAGGALVARRKRAAARARV